MNIVKTIALTTAALAIGIAPVAITAQSTDSDSTVQRERRFRPDQRPEQGGPEHGRPDHRAGKHKPHELIAFWEKDGISEALALDQSQIDLLDQSLTAAKDALEAEKASLKAANEALRELMDTDNPDLDAVLNAIDEVSASKTTIAKATTGHRVAVKNILTPEQEETLKGLIKERVRDGIRDRIEERMGDRPCGPGGEGFPGPDFGDDEDGGNELPERPRRPVNRREAS